ncbi:MAG: VanW family protein [Clostridia bacterium]|nr:VanW family protein [Clostridia bacterium]
MKIIGKTTKTLLVCGAFFLICAAFSGQNTEKNTEMTQQSAVVCGKNGKDNPYGWEKLSAYTTYYNANEGGRCENIAIASRLIDGITIQAFGEFSFNQTVGRRTEEAGFQQAKIIANGEYVEGVGGGVCQVSTTLYNAALKSGLVVTEYHPHSLQVGYVPPSRDAMVSTHNDLKLYNPYAEPVYLSAKVFDGGVKIVFFGKNEGDRYEITTKIVGEIPPPAPIVKPSEKEEVIRAERKGIQSEMYLERYRGNQLLSKKRIRKDEYRPVQGIIAKKIVNTTN